MKKFQIIGLTFALFIGVIFTAACAMTTKTIITPTTSVETSDSGTTDKMLVVITQIDLDKMNISFQEVGTNEEEIYPYNGGTMFYSESGVSMAAGQIMAGDVVDLYFDTGSHLISKVQDSTNGDVWSNSKVTSFSFDDTTHSMTIGQSLFSYSDDTFVVSNGEAISIMELNSMDQLTVRGYGNKVVSIVVDKGHGYIKLTGDEFFVGGLVNVDGILVKEIDAGMMLIVTEGTHKVSVVNGAYSAEKNVTVVRDEDSEVDFSDVQAIVTETGNVKFSIDVTDATLTIDDVATDYTSIVTLTTGSHTIEVAADGYTTYTGTITVESGYQTITITLDTDSTTATDETTTEAETTTVAGETVVSSINDVTISGPTGGSVYFDGIYKGVAPVTFDLVTGTHVVSILYDGEISSYTVNLAEGGDDVTYDFTDK